MEAVSQAQRRTLLLMSTLGTASKSANGCLYFAGGQPVGRESTFQSLIHKQLLEWSCSEKGWAITKKGRLLVDLLKTGAPARQTRKPNPSQTARLTDAELDSAVAVGKPLFMLQG
jgi:hypothetical protein